MSDTIETLSTGQSLAESARFIFSWNGHAGSFSSGYFDADEEIAVNYDTTAPQNVTKIESGETVCFKYKYNLGELPGIGTLSKLISVELTIEPGNFAVNCEELAIYADGENIQEVWEEFVSLFQEQYEYYVSLPTDKLSDRAAVIRLNFLTILPKK